MLRSLKRFNDQLTGSARGEQFVVHAPPLLDAWGVHHSKVRRLSLSCPHVEHAQPHGRWLQMALERCHDKQVCCCFVQAFVIEYEGGMRVIVHTGGDLLDRLPFLRCCQLTSRELDSLLSADALTANLIYVDCTNKTQGLWWQDFPPKVKASGLMY